MQKVHPAPEAKTSSSPDSTGNGGDGGGGGASNGKVVTSRHLSWLAETADGTRDADLALVKNGSGELEIIEAPKAGASLPSGYSMVSKVRTDGSCNREKVKTVRIETEHYGPQPEIEAPGPDAVFWTESAVEKFLYPYYHSQRLWDENMDKLRAKFRKDKKAYAMLHRAPSNSETLDAKGSLEVARLKPGLGAEETELEWVGLMKYLES